MSLRLPKPVRERLRLPSRLAVFTESTLTEKIFSMAIFSLELLIAGLQAYVFTLLTAMYIAGAVSDDH